MGKKEGTPVGSVGLVKLRFTNGIPIEILEATRDDVVLRKMVISAITDELVFKSHYPKWLQGIAWWWHITPLWERAVAVVLSPISCPLALGYLILWGVTMIPLGVCCLWEYVSDGLRGKESD